jgi:hypothetical protein
MAAKHGISPEIEVISNPGWPAATHHVPSGRPRAVPSSAWGHFSSPSILIRPESMPALAPSVQPGTRRPSCRMIVTFCPGLPET